MAANSREGSGGARRRAAPGRLLLHLLLIPPAEVCPISEVGEGSACTGTVVTHPCDDDLPCRRANPAACDTGDGRHTTHDADALTSTPALRRHGTASGPNPLRRVQDSGRGCSPCAECCSPPDCSPCPQGRPGGRLEAMRPGPRPQPQDREAGAHHLRRGPLHRPPSFCEHYIAFTLPRVSLSDPPRHAAVPNAVQGSILCFFLERVPLRKWPSLFFISFSFPIFLNFWFFCLIPG